MTETRATPDQGIPGARNGPRSPVPTKDTDLAAWQRKLLGGEYGNMLSCVRCGQCLTSCPTYVLSGNEAEGPRGRVAMMRMLQDGRISLTPDLIKHEQNCLVCDACTAVCPAGVHMDPLQVALRTAISPNIRRSWRERLIRHLTFRYLFGNMRLFRGFVFLLWLYQRSGLQALARGLGIIRVLGMKETEAFLPPVDRPFLVPKGEIYRAERASVSDASLMSRSGSPSAGIAPPDTLSATLASATERVSFFAGCVMSTAMADIDRATIRVFQRAGCDVVNTAEQGCCGALNAHSGDLDGAKVLARRNIAAFERDGDAPIVVNSAGCGAMLKDYAHHFREDTAWAERARAFSARVKDATQLLAGRPLPMRRPLDAAVTYQEPCHLAHAQRITQQPRALLKSIPGLELREMAESSLCCGSAGVYNVTNPNESRQLQRRKLDNAAATGAPIIATANPGCLIQLQSGLAERGDDTRVKHILELLDEATTPRR